MKEETKKELSEINTMMSLGVKLIMAPFFIALALFMMFIAYVLLAAIW